MASVWTFAKEISEIEISGVKKRLFYHPKSLSSADIPTSFVMAPGADYSLTATCTAVNDEFSVPLVVAIEAAGQNTQPVNQEALYVMMDAINSALKSFTPSEMTSVTWSMTAQTQQPIILDTTAYWGVTTIISGRGAK